jgi:hypothetical protein
MTRYIGICILFISCLLLTITIDAQQLSYSPMSDGVASGTLNIAVANLNGIVIATDSRETTGIQARNDTSKKLFRTGQSIAMAIAGFSRLLYQSPYQFEVAATIAKRYKDYAISEKPSSLADQADWCAHIFGCKLNQLASILSTYSHYGKKLDMSIMVAGLGTGDTAEIHLIRFRPKFERSGFDSSYFAMVEWFGDTPLRATSDSVIYRTVGVSYIADPILQGKYRGANKLLKDYTERYRTRSTGSMTLQELKLLVIEIFKETMSHPECGRYVNGDIQIGAFGPSQYAEWHQKEFVVPEPQLIYDLLRTGEHFQNDTLVCCSERAGGCGVFDSGIHPMIMQPDSIFIFNPEHKVFVGNLFEDCTIVLDANDFYGNTFKNCRFIYGGGRMSFDNNNIDNCTFGVSQDLTLDLSKNEQLWRLVRRCLGWHFPK